MLKQIKPAVLSVLVMTIMFGFIFPGIVTAFAQVAFHHQANGSLITVDGKVVGSEIIGQQFTLPKYFHPRPSAAGSGYDAANSSGTNLGPTSDKLINGIHKTLPDGSDDPGNFDGIKDLAEKYRVENGLAPDAEVPADAATRSSSGLDPDISPANAEFQVARVATSRGLSQDQVRQLVTKFTSKRFIGIYGEPRVNVLKLNMALDELK